MKNKKMNQINNWIKNQIKNQIMILKKNQMKN